MAPLAAVLALAGGLGLAVAPSTASEPQRVVVPTPFSRWRRGRYSLDSTAGSIVTANVTQGGAFVLVRRQSPGASLRLVISSSFSEAADEGGVLRYLNDSAATADWPGPVSVDRSAAGSGVWVVRAQARQYRLARTYRWHEARLEVSDRLVPTSGGGVIGIEVRHTAQIDGQAAVVEAVVPGGAGPFDCGNPSTFAEWGQLGHGNPSVYMDLEGEAEPGGGPGPRLGVGLLARDTVFAVHAQTQQLALPRYPRMPHSLPPCAVTSPPSVTLADPHFAMRANDTDGYEMRWDAFVTADAEGCSGYFCMINRAREAVGSTLVQLPGNGLMGSFAPEWYPVTLLEANYTAQWWNWTDQEVGAFLAHNSLKYPIAFGSWLDRGSNCRPAVREMCFGACVLHEMPQDVDRYLRTLVPKIRAAAPYSGGLDPKVTMYFHPYINTERGAIDMYPDSLVTSRDGAPQAYTNCTANGGAFGNCSLSAGGCIDEPMLFPALRNSYGETLRGYVSLAMDKYDLDGIYQ